MTLLVVSAVILVVAMALLLARAVRGPTPCDRVLAVNAAGTKTVLLLAGIGALTGRDDFVDIALAYVLVNFVVAIAVLKFFRHGSLAPALEPDEQEEADGA